MSTIEVVLWTPIIVGFFMLIVAFGFLVNSYGDIQNAASDAARAGSLQRDPVSAQNAALAAAQADLPTQCVGGPAVSPDENAFAAGNLYTIQLTCTVSLGGLDWFQIGDKTFTVTASAPLDAFRRSTP
ncbi:MAG TPA: TadE family protein [Actinocrinis sp.]|jgi:Flp pilus assembly protein TadG